MINSMVASMSFDAEDKTIAGRVLDIDDIIAFHGESVSEFETNFHEASEAYLAASKELSAPSKLTLSNGISIRRPRTAEPIHQCR